MSNVMRGFHAVSVFAALLFLQSCGSAPVKTVYVLGAPAAPVAGVASNAGKPTVELRPAAVPDYLDSTDLQTRDGRNEVKISQTGRWGERLSIGVTSAVEDELARRLPAISFERSDASGPASRTLLINVDAFDVRSDGHCVLVAHWTILGEDRRPAVSRRATIVTPVSSPSDAGAVAAMTAAVSQLAGDIAADLTRVAPKRAGS